MYCIIINALESSLDNNIIILINGNVINVIVMNVINLNDITNYLFI